MLCKSVPIDLLLARLGLDVEAGLLTWKFRPRDTFHRDRDFKLWNQRFSGQPALNSQIGQGYLGGKIAGTNFFAHRVVWAIAALRWPVGEIDHINGVRSDNRLCNLRDISRRENAINRGKTDNGKSLFVGVSWHGASGKWRSRAQVAGQRVSLGLFESEAEAATARNNALDAAGILLARRNFVEKL
ncbi:MAG: HNH endonuclease [Paracoccaceae bacterium]